MATQVTRAHMAEAMMSDEPNKAKLTSRKNIRLAWVFGIVVLLWYVVAMLVIWTQ